MSTVADLGTRRQIRDLGKQVDALAERMDISRLESDPALRQRIFLTRAQEILDHHATLLAHLRPAMRELVELFAAAVNARDVAVATQLLLDDAELMRELPARIAARRAMLPAEYKRQLATYGAAHFEVTES